MSLDVLAHHLATKGRNGDSMLVHMTPGEVHGLHALALAHGGRLTINPETGLPEANFLKKLLPAIAGAALNFFAPGIGTAIGGALGLGGAAGSAIAVGGITGLATGSLQKGLMAGLGAYGGAGLTDALLGGAGAAGAAGALGVEGAASGAGSQAAMLAEQAAGFGGEGLKSLAESAAYAKGATPSLSAAFSAGADAAMKNPGAFLKGAAKPLMYAAAPVLADAMVPTVTPRESKPGETGYIRPRVIDMSSFGQAPGSFTTLDPIAANQVTYPAPPPGGAAGGIVALAGGGWTGDIPAPGDSRRAEFERYLASQMSPAEFEQTRVNPNSVLSPTFSRNLAANLQGQKDLAAQGLQSVFGGSFTGLGGHYHHAIQDASSPTDAVSRYLNAMTIEKPMGGGMAGEQDLNTLLNQYVGTALTDANSAADTLARMRALGFDPYAPNQAGMLEALDPEFRDKMYYKYSDPNRADKSAVDPNQILYNRMVAGVRNPWEMAPSPLAVAPAAPAPEETIQGGIGALPRADTTQAQPTTTAAAPGTSTESAFVLPRTGQAVQDSGTVTGGGVTTNTTSTTPTFQLPPAEQIMRVPSGTITGGTVTGAIDTKKALEEYERTAPTGRAPTITSTNRFDGYVGDDKTYGDKTPFTPLTQPGLGTAGSVSRGTETAQDVYREVGNRYAPPTFNYNVSNTGASKSAYDYLMGQGAYPTNQTMPGGAPLWKPYVEAVGATAPNAFARIKPPSATGTTGTTGTASGIQTWVNTQTGHRYYAPAGFKPEGSGWVLEEAASPNPSTDGGGEGIGGLGDAGDGGAAGVAGIGGDGVGGTGSGVGGDNAKGGLIGLAMGGATGGQYNLGSYSDGGRLLRGPGDGVSDSIPATIGRGQPARLADGEFVVPARIVSELGNGSTEAGARKLYAMMDRVQRARRKTTGKKKVAVNTRTERLLPA
jgi:hypothetical protein